MVYVVTGEYLNIATTGPNLHQHEQARQSHFRRTNQHNMNELRKGATELKLN